MGGQVWDGLGVVHTYLRTLYCFLQKEVECLANSTRGGRYIVVWIERRDEFDGRWKRGEG